jgi:hypothetical protein
MLAALSLSVWMTRPSEIVLRNWDARATAGYHSRRPQQIRPTMIPIRADRLRACQLEGWLQSLENPAAMPAGLGDARNLLYGSNNDGGVVSTVSIACDIYR